MILEQKWYRVLFTLNLLSGVLLILLKKRDQEVHEFFFSCFLRKNLFLGNLIISSHFLMFEWVWSKLSQVTVTIGSLKIQNMIKILKQSGHDFSGKRLSRYTFSVIRHYVMSMYGGQYST